MGRKAVSPAASHNQRFAFVFEVKNGIVFVTGIDVHSGSLLGHILEQENSSSNYKRMALPSRMAFV